MTASRDTDWVQELVRKVLVGKRLVSLKMIALHAWDFRFGEIHFNVGSPWRILGPESILLGSCDHAQKFGLLEPVDAARQAFEMLEGMPIESVKIAPLSSDLQVRFQGGMVLDVFNYSSGYEGWNVSSSEGQVIALGGGELAVCGKTP